MFSGQEKSTILRFTTEMENVQKISRKKIIWRGLLNSITQTIPGMAYGVALAYGGFMVAEKEIHYKYVMRYSKTNQLNMRNKKSYKNGSL